MSARPLENNHVRPRVCLPVSHRLSAAWLVLVACGGTSPSPAPISATAPPDAAVSAGVPVPVAPLATPGEPLVTPPALDLGPPPSDPAVQLVGRDDTCAVLASGAVSCWGPSFSAVTRMPWTDVTALSLGATACLRHRDGSAECGTFAGGTFTRRLRVERDVDEIIAGDRVACVVQRGAVSCMHAAGVLQRIPNLSGASHLVLFQTGDGMEDPITDIGCALVARGRVSCFRLEYRMHEDAIVGVRASAARRVPGIEGATHLLTSGFERVCADLGRDLRCVSVDARGNPGSVELGDRASATSHDECEIDGDLVTCMMSIPGVPMSSKAVTLPRPTQALAVGPHACAIFGRGRVACWGSNGSHGLGREAPLSNTRPALGLPDAIDLAGVDGRMFAVRSNGQLVAWGLGGRDAGYTDLPRTMSSVDDAISVVATVSMGCVLRRRGRVSCWHISDGDVHEIEAVRGATQLVSDGGGVLARIGTRWKRIHSNVPPDLEDLPELDGATEVSRVIFTCIRDVKASSLRCFRGAAQVVIPDVVEWAAVQGISAGDPGEYLAIRHAGGRAEVIGLDTYSGPLRLSRLGVVSSSAREVFRSNVDLCVRDTSGEVRCGRGGAWLPRDAPAKATKLMVDKASCGLMPDHTVLCTSGDPWLFGTGVASSERPVRIAL